MTLTGIVISCSTAMNAQRAVHFDLRFTTRSQSTVHAVGRENGVRKANGLQNVVMHFRIVEPPGVTAHLAQELRTANPTARSRRTRLSGFLCVVATTCRSEFSVPSVDKGIDLLGELLSSRAPALADLGSMVSYEMLNEKASGAFPRF